LFHKRNLNDDVGFYEVKIITCKLGVAKNLYRRATPQIFYLSDAPIQYVWTFDLGPPTVETKKIENIFPINNLH
jgi:hypothetical protein